MSSRLGISAQDKQIQVLVNDVKEGHLQLPELQRKYVWKSTQVRDFFDSLYRQYPTGHLLVWETDDLPYAHNLSAKGIRENSRRPQLLLDGTAAIDFTLGSDDRPALGSA